MHSCLISLVIGMLMLAAARAQAQTPTLVTLAATGVTDSNAVFNGTIDPNGGTFEVRAEFGLTTSYGYITQGSSYFFGSGVQPCSFTPFGLPTNTTFHFRITATTLDGNTKYVGNDMTLTTLANLPSVGAAGAGVSNLNPADVSFYAQNVSAGSSEATISFEYGLTTAYGSTATYPTTLQKDAFTSMAGNFHVLGFLPSTTYHFRAKIVNQQGTVYSADNTFTTPSGPELVTSPATGITDLAATLKGNANTDGLSLNLSFEYGLTTDYGLSIGIASPNPINSSGAAVTSPTPEGLLPSTTYHYRLKGVWIYDSGFVYYANDRTFTTGPAATPPTVGSIGTSSLAATAASVYCWPVFSGSSITSAVFEYGTTTAYGSSASATDIPTNVPGASPSVDLTGLTPGTTYHVRCTVTNAQGTATSEDGTFATPLIPVVTTAAASNIGDLAATLGGSINPNGASSTATPIFEIGTTTAYGSTVAATPDSILSGSLTPFTGTATGLLPSTTYHYRAKVTYSVTNSVFYGPDITFTTGPAATLPTVYTPFVFPNAITATYAPVETFVVYSGSSSAVVSWEYGTTTAYGGTAISSPATVDMNTSSTATASFHNLTPGTTYHYRCKATNSEGTGYSPDATFTTLPAPSLVTGTATSITDLTAVLNGTANANGGSYTPLFHVNLPSGFTLVVAPTSPSITGTSTLPVTASVSGLLPSTTYTYRIVSRNSNQDYFFGGEQSFTTGPPATPPTVTSVSSSNVAPTAVTLAVNSLSTGSTATTLAFEYGLTNAYGSQVTYGSTFPAGTNASPTYQLQGLSPNTTYHFRATVTNNEGTNASSDATFTTLNLPTVTTDSAAGITATSATLNGTYNKQGANYTIAFDYGLTTSYGQTATSGGIIFTGGGFLIGGGGIIIGTGGGADFTTHTTSVPVSLLSPQTTYHYRLKLTDNYGNSYYGSDATFTTLSPVEAWRALKFGDTSNTGDGADNASPSGDGIPNLLKYALGMDPAVPSTQPQAVLTDVNGGKHLCMTFFRYVANTDINCEVQTADSPGGPWVSVATSAGGAYTGPGLVSENPFVYNFVFNGLGFSQVLVANQVVLCDPVSTDDTTHRFMRLKVTR
jgi:hypothetical protein